MIKIRKYFPIIIGSFIILGLITFSFIYTYFIKDTIKSAPALLYNAEGKLIDTYGYPPSWKYLFGVDRFGRDVFWMVIDGAKYTLSIAIVVGLMRVILGGFLGSFFGFMNQRLLKIIEPILNAFRFVPAVIIIFPFFERLNDVPEVAKEKTIALQIALLIIISIPVLMNSIGEEVRAFLKNDFITSSRIIGARNGWIRRKHVIPYLQSRILLLFVQQTIQTLFLLTQLGVFKLFIGGVKVLSLDINVDRPMSQANEWSGMIGANYIELSIDKWVIVGPSIAFIVSIFAFNLIKLGIERLMENQTGHKQKQLMKNEELYEGLNDFDFVNKEKLNEVKRIVEDGPKSSDQLVTR
ncbi:peptide ABC transporter permease [Gottfriedia acidiceleris]|uniref:Peptide ABC transporter permease n=1 Tax=Gottfriedia acidiceleris TaxID=371036 RepID=A0ABY4JHK1_9BACI|nr:peptide ABC transporter permease [Gottfriedia acidiceleris]UPM52569.1 peptide ABC transporter permease [Gottfriedia acidiceleris]